MVPGTVATDAVHTAGMVATDAVHTAAHTAATDAVHMAATDVDQPATDAVHMAATDVDQPATDAGMGLALGTVGGRRVLVLDREDMAGTAALAVALHSPMRSMQVLTCVRPLSSSSRGQDDWRVELRDPGHWSSLLYAARFLSSCDFPFLGVLTLLDAFIKSIP
ncbi:hypothetical protein ccbrp13_03300 [Ktedonobacteria bacterium brp13]|nr:hypothetical protein ccbrp13_03300 [Ktedonobacteria bacterium brp13]